MQILKIQGYSQKDETVKTTSVLNITFLWQEDKQVYTC